MKHRLLLPGVIALVLLLAACSPPPPLRDDTLLQDTSLTSSDAACTAPCWHGITPGVTAWRDALTILDDDATLDFDATKNVQSDDKSTAKVANFQQKGGAACCQMFTEDGEKVNVLFLRIAPKVTMGQLVAAHGEPTYIVGSPYSDDQAVMNLIYPQQSMVIYAFVAGSTGAISESSEIIAELFMTPKDMDLLIKTSSLHTWDGYKSYQLYDSATFEVTPEITLTPTPTGA